MKMYILRHGQTPWNARKCLQGRSDVDLNENGIYLAELTGKALRDVTFDMAFTSPLIRAKHTAQCILAGREVPIIEDERLIEISFGIYEGCCYAEENRQVPQQWIENFFHAPQDYVAAPGGESLDDVEKRTRDFMEDICSRKELQDKTILVSTHGCALRGLLNSIRESNREDYWHGGVSKNCAVSIVTCNRGEKPVLVEENHIYY
ncbi:histidine phosphatase family protein [Hominisplanchenecus sp.]|uniref:histidine phosphatase family protein n=1 Tax=Hominisplanchenecus sp. TaxID=3038130 RepID=UPI003995399C